MKILSLRDDDFCLSARTSVMDVQLTDDLTLTRGGWATAVMYTDMTDNMEHIDDLNKNILIRTMHASETTSAQQRERTN